MFIDLLKQELGVSKAAGSETRFCCPFCGESSHKFYVHNNSGVWICFKCESKGNPLTFVKDFFNVDYVEAVDILAMYDYDINAEMQNRNAVSLSAYGNDLTEEEQLLMFITYQGSSPMDTNNIVYKCPSLPTNCKSLVANFNNPEAFPFFAYLNSRGVTLEQIHTHNISYVTYGEVSLADGRKMELRNHVIFFTFNNNRKPVYWNTRSIEEHPFIKSFNAPSREDEYSKNNTVFNLNNARKSDKIVVHEGVFNAFMTPGSGVATFGKMITESQVRLILDETKDRNLPIYLFLDTDAWERMIASASIIHRIEPSRPVYYVYSGLEKDANELGIDYCKELLDNAFVADAMGEIELRLANMI